VPTFAEAGLPIEGSAWFMVMGPAGLPQPVVERLNAEVNKALSDAGLLGKFKDLGVEPMGGTPKAAADYLASEYRKWGEVVRLSGAKID
jgi:tripartite-type tricarboxylate transporter receptor subunit TctC